MNIHEHQAKQILKKYGADILEQELAIKEEKLLKNEKTKKSKKIDCN